MRVFAIISSVCLNDAIKVHNQGLVKTQKGIQSSFENGRFQLRF